LPGLVAKVRQALSGDQYSAAVAGARVEATPVVSEPPPSRVEEAPEPDAAQSKAQSSLAPAVPVSESIHRDYILSLEDGKPYRSLRRHLMAKYGMTPDDYRRKWGLPSDYPMVAPSYAQDRSDVAKRIGLGRSKARPAEPARSARRR
jgi:predicted transcriptional regulator